ncbi:MAG: tRNA (adenosine(37)-N6)-threonylcarbamoyltransferase complex dimerization subunit type 1 TsaB [Burkholderiaceae bacterium]|nr:tRNA (adenosine(37)-N6)-threonylcarbamoyltransferase complex dimerization subunit type 1 TsaB [Burkholderiaceae bacterium]
MLIAIETSSPLCSVALARMDRGELRCTSRVEGPGIETSRRVLAMIESLLDEAGLARDALEAIAFDAGPGSFTGLRIGCGVAQGLGYALSVPLVAVPSLEVLAVAARLSSAALDPVRATAGAGDEPQFPAGVLVASDARMGQVYACAYRDLGGRLRARDEIAVYDPPQALRYFGQVLDREKLEPASVLVAGGGFGAAAILDQWVARAGFARAPHEWPDAVTLARLAYARLAAGETVAAQDAGPLYVRDKVALDVDEQRALRTKAGP